MSSMALLLLSSSAVAAWMALWLSSKETADGNRRSHAGNAGEKQISKTLTALGIPHVDDVVFEFRGYSVQVDHVVALGDRLIAIETKNMRGVIQAPDRGDWTQTVGRDRRRMQNPTEQNTWHCKAIGNTWGIWCGGVVVLAGSGRVVGNWPHGVTRLKSMAAALASAAGRADISDCLPPSKHATSALANIARMAGNGQAKLKVRHVSWVSARYSGPKWAERWGAGAAILAALAYKSW